MEEILMDEYPKEVSLKAGQKLTLRLLKEDDIDSLFNFFKGLGAYPCKPSSGCAPIFQVKKADALWDTVLKVNK